MAQGILSKDAQLYIARFISLALASVAGALFGFVLLPHGAVAALVWPSSAIGMAALFLFGYDLWPAILLTIAAVLFVRNGNLPLDVTVALGDTLEALLGAYILKRYVRFNPLINTLGNGLGIIAASIIPTLISGGIVTFATYYFGDTNLADIQTTWATLWIGHAVTCLSFAPFLIRWLYRPFFTKTWKEILEGIVIFSSISGISYLLFWTTYNSVGSISLIYILILPLLWAAIRSGPRGTTLALALLSLISTTGVVYGHGPLSVVHNPQTIFLLQVLLGVLDIIFILIAAIIEERKDITNSLAASVAQLESAIEKIRLDDQAKTNFLAILAHELRNPLAPIFSSVELLKLKVEKSAAEQTELIGTIESHTRMISLLLDDLLDITRITHNKFELRREPVTMQRVLASSVNTVKTFITARKHTLKLDIPQGEIWLNADPVRLEQIFINLLNNAAKYTDEGGTITLACKVQGGYAVVSVADNGIGMAADKMGGIFELFGQIRDLRRGSGGLGVGLSLTKRLVELHGGTVEASSSGLGLGSEFTTRLPLMNTQTPALKRPGIIAALTRKKDFTQTLGVRILIVDDNEPAAKGLGKLLKHAGYEVMLAYNGKEALATMEAYAPSAVILDIGLPDMDGYEVGQKMREQAGQTSLRLIALTGYGQEEHRAKTHGAGFDAHLVKPVSIADVENALQ